MDRFDFIATSLTDLISTRYFTVPRYQRSFAWSDDQTKDYWLDMLSSINNGGDYFLGNIVLTENDTPNTYSIIDGQQRVATTTILNAAIRDAYVEKGESDIAAAIQQQMICALDTATFEKVARIQLNEIDNPFYRDLIIEKSTPKPSCDSHELIESAYLFFKKNIDEIIVENPTKWREEIGKISHFLKSQSKVVAVYAANDADAFTIFETLNDRGADLTIADLLKNYLFSKSGNEIDSVQNNWIETRAILEEYQDETEFVTFLRHYWSSVHGMTRERELYRDIKEKISSKSHAVKFSQEMKNGAKLYGAARSEKADFWKSYSDGDRNNMKLLLRLKLEQNRPLLISIFQHFSKSEIQKTLPALVAWSVRGLVAGVMGKGAAEVAFCDAATKIRSGAIKTRDDLGSALSGLIPRDSAFTSSFANYRTTNNGLARYLLLAIERHLEGSSQPEFVPNEDGDEINLEHILPRKAKKDEWPNFSPDEVGFHSIRLGNMTLIKERKNNALGNKSFAIKQPVLAASKLALNSEFAAKQTWVKADIDSRQGMLSQLAPLVWKL